jgi:hypothetical protein
MTTMAANATEGKAGHRRQQPHIRARQHAGPQQDQAAEPHRHRGEVQHPDDRAHGGIGPGGGMPAQRRGEGQRGRQHPDRRPGAGACPRILPLRPGAQEGNQQQQQQDAHRPDAAEARPDGLGKQRGVQGLAEREARGERAVQQQPGERAEQGRPPGDPEQPPGSPLHSPGQPPGWRRQPGNGDEARSAKQHQQAGQDDQAIHRHERAY